FLTLLILLLSFIPLNYTRWPLRFKAIPQNPQAADVARINIYKYKWHPLFISALIAGIAGTFFAQIRLGQLQQSYDIQALGYLALAIIITSQWKISISVLISLMFSIVYWFSFYGVQYFSASYKNYSELFNILPFITTLIVMIASCKKRNAG
ncbi:ABC transporter permease subunit, partial [Mycoplasmopsis synoviae]